jgi:4'-phosphopantetheinyl transferase
MDDLQLHPSFAPVAPGSVRLAPGEVHVWAIPLTGEPEQFQDLLSATERARSERFRFLDHRRRHVIAHGCMRVILGGCAGADPAVLEIAIGTRGKPFLPRYPHLHFNLSHSGHLALLAVGDRELGVDVEKLRHLESLQDIARRHFSQAEFEALCSLPEDRQLQGFYRLWTRKEAYIKAVGVGLSMPLDVFDVSLADEARFLGFRDGNEDPALWTLRDVSPGPGYTGALAVRTAQAAVRLLAATAT